MPRSSCRTSRLFRPHSALIVMFVFFLSPSQIDGSLYFTRLLRDARLEFPGAFGTVLLFGSCRLVLSWVREITAPGTALMVPGAFFCAFGGSNGDEVICRQSPI